MTTQQIVTLLVGSALGWSAGALVGNALIQPGLLPKINATISLLGLIAYWWLMWP